MVLEARLHFKGNVARGLAQSDSGVFAHQVPCAGTDVAALMPLWRISIPNQTV